MKQHWESKATDKFILVIIALMWNSSLTAAQQQGINSHNGLEKDGISATSAEQNQTAKLPSGLENLKQPEDISDNNLLYISIITVACIVGTLGFLVAGLCWYRRKNVMLATARVLYRSSDSSILIHKNKKVTKCEIDDAVCGTRTLNGLAKKTDYPAYGVTGPNPLHEQSYEPAIDGTLNRSAEVYHYNQTKKRMKALSSNASDSGSTSRTHGSLDNAAELDVNDEETSDGEYTVYECSGMASATDGPMEVRNPLFDDMPSKTNSNGGFSYRSSTTFSENISAFSPNRRVVQN